VKSALQFLPLLSAILVGAPAFAQGIDLGSGGPVEVTARGTFEIHDQQQEVVAEGDARAVRGTTTVLADRLIARYRKRGTGPQGQSQAQSQAPSQPQKTTDSSDTANGNEVYRLEAHGHVRIVTPTDEVVGDDAVYDLDQAALVITGKGLKLSTPTAVLTARDSLEYWSNQHMAVGRGHAVVVTNDARQVSADILVAYTDPDSQAAGPQTASAAGGKTGSSDPTANTGKIKRVDAFGNVEVRTTQDIVHGDNGLYLPQTGQGRVVGHVRINRGDNEIEGPAADFDMKTGVARIVAQKGARVEGLIAPNNAPVGPNSGAPAAKQPAAKP
jgi:lipopolysaccharide export system protein LptA